MPHIIPRRWALLCGTSRINRPGENPVVVAPPDRHTCNYTASEDGSATMVYCYPVDADRGLLLCPDCFADANGFSPIDTLMCNECFVRPNDRGECDCTGFGIDLDDDVFTRPPNLDPFVLTHDPDMPEGGHGNEPEAKELTDDDPDVPMGSMLFRSLADRPMRMVSFEQEIGKGGNYIAEMLYDAGLTRHDYMMGYHSSREFDEHNRPFVTVEEDSSVAAELVWSCMELDRPEHARKLELGLEIVREAMKEKRVQLDMRCGGHLHVDVPDYFPPDIASAHTLWSYVEDTIFRLSAANWKCHRTEIQQGNYSPPVPKGGETRLASILNAQQAGRAALNFGHLFNALAYCRCGAIQWGQYQDCQCPRPQCTLEFRVFNTTANPTKLRAYIAMSVGLIQYAKDHACTPDRFPEMEWNGDSKNVDVANSVERLSFILNELPMEAADREAIRYCIERSSLAPCVEFL